MTSEIVGRDADWLRVTAPADGQRWYALCGTRLYCIGTLAGLFPDTGMHQPDEMGGIWAPPLKLLDGYWLALRPGDEHGWMPRRRTAVEPIHCLTAPSTWQMGPEGVTLEYALPALGLHARRREWIVPDEPVLVVDVEIARMEGTEGGHPLHLECGLVVRSDLHGVWLSEERLGWKDGDDAAVYEPGLGATLIGDTLHPWSVCVGATEPAVTWQAGREIWGPEHTNGRGTGVALWYRRRVTQDHPAHLRFLIVGDGESAERARASFAMLSRSPDRLDRADQQARERFREPFARTELASPDAHLDTVFAWAKADMAMLALDVPGLGRAAMAGLPEFPWWFGADLAYGVLPMLPAGQTREAVESLRTLAEMSRRHGTEGLVPHEVVTNGLLFHPGNLVEIPLFARALYHTYRWTGDRALLDDLLPFCLRGIEEHMLGLHLQTGEQVPSGTSIVETPEMAADLQALDVAAYFVEALDLLAFLADEAGQREVGSRQRERGAQARQHVRDEWWLAGERLFGDVRASRAELEQMERRFAARAEHDPGYAASVATLRRALDRDADPQASAHVRRPWLLLHMVQALALDAGLPAGEQAAQMLARLETPEWTERFGVVLNAAGNRQVMTLPTGALAVGEARYGRVDGALSYIRRIAETWGAAMPGAISEYSPDGGCFLQLWSSYGIIWPIVHYIFGLRPHVAGRQLICAPQLPAEWPSGQLRAIPVGDAQVDIALSAMPNGVRVYLETSAPDWGVAMGVGLPAGVRVQSATVNGREVSLQPLRLPEWEGRETWVAPMNSGVQRYDLVATWPSG